MRSMKWLRTAIDGAGGVHEVARLTKLSVPHVANLYRGTRPLGAASARALRRVLNVPDSVWLAALLKVRRKPAHAEAHEGGQAA